MPKNNDAGLLFRNGRSFRIFVTSLKIQNLDSNSTHFSDFVTEDQKKTYTCVLNVLIFVIRRIRSSFLATFFL